MIHRSKCPLLSGYTVRWCHDIPIVDGDAQMDKADDRSRDFTTLDKATAFALKMAQTAVFGYAKIAEFRMEPVDPQYTNVLEREYAPPTRPWSRKTARSHHSNEHHLHRHCTLPRLRVRCGHARTSFYNTP